MCSDEKVAIARISYATHTTNSAFLFFFLRCVVTRQRSKALCDELKVKMSVEIIPFSPARVCLRHKTNIALMEARKYAAEEYRVLSPPPELHQNPENIYISKRHNCRWRRARVCTYFVFTYALNNVWIFCARISSHCQPPAQPLARAHHENINNNVPISSVYMWLYFFLLFWGGLRAPHIRHVYAVRIVSTGHKRGKMYALAHTHGVLMFLYIHTHHAHWWCDDAGMCLDVRMSHTCGLVCYTNNNYRIIRYTYYYTKALVYNRDTAAHFFFWTI